MSSMSGFSRDVAVDTTNLTRYGTADGKFKTSSCVLATMYQAVHSDFEFGLQNTFNIRTVIAFVFHSRRPHCSNESACEVTRY